MKGWEYKLAINPSVELLKFVAKVTSEVAGKESTKITKMLNASAKFKDGVNPTSRYDRSIRGQADRYVLQYPIVISNQITLDDAMIIRNQVEMERANELLLTLNNTLVEIGVDPSSEFLQGLHSNINLGESSLDDIKRINEILSTPQQELLENTSLNGLTVPFLLKEEESIVDPYDGEGFDEPDLNSTDWVKGADNNYYNSTSDMTYNSQTKHMTVGNSAHVVPSYEIERKDSNGKSVLVDRRGIQSHSTPLMDPKFSEAKITNMDMRKLNSSIPLIIETKAMMTFGARAENTGSAITNRKGQVVGTSPREMVIKFGVKGINHTVDTDDIIYYLSDSTKRSNLLTRFVKLTTGEISLVKDVLLNLDRSKHMAKDKNKSKVWKNLNMLFEVERMNRYYSSGKNGGLLPTTTLAITIDEVERIRNRTGIHLINDKVAAAKIYDELFLLDFLIVDEVNDVLYKYMPKHKGFDPYKMSSLAGNSINDQQKGSGNLDLFKKFK